MPQLKQIASSDQNTVLTQLEQEIVALINVHRVATVTNVDESRIEVRLYDLMESTSINGLTTSTYPPLKCMWLAPKNMIAMLNVGDIVLVGFNDVSLSNAFYKQDQQISRSSRRHDLSDGVILNVLQYAKPDNTKIGFAYGDGSSAVEMTIGENTGAIINAGSKKVNIKNSATDLKVVLQDVVSALNQVSTTLNQVVTTLNSFASLGSNAAGPVNSVAVPGQTTAITTQITNLGVRINQFSTDLTKLLT